MKIEIRIDRERCGWTVCGEFFYSLEDAEKFLAAEKAHLKRKEGTMPVRNYTVTVQHPDNRMQTVTVQAVSQFDAMNQVKKMFSSAKVKAVKSSAW